jgi:acyl-coenzyme A thioesterase PaaI-like protein
MKLVPLPFLLRWLMRFWPPYLGAGIRVTKVAEDLSLVEVEMKLRPWNQNYVGTQFGGSLYSMTDPFLMLMLMHRLGPAYVVWDKSATIRFKRPGRGRVVARFELPASQVSEIRARVDAERKVEPQFQVKIVDEAGAVVAEVDKTLYVRRKDSLPKGEAVLSRVPA